MLDFPENFSFVIQGEARDFYWQNPQCTVHPFVVHHEKSDDDEITHKSFCFFIPKHKASCIYSVQECTGIAGMVKKMTAKAGLQRPFENQILTPQDMYAFCKENFGEKISFSILPVKK